MFISKLLITYSHGAPLELALTKKLKRI